LAFSDFIFFNELTPSQQATCKKHKKKYGKKFGGGKKDVTFASAFPMREAKKGVH
jgi:hypothetical protein